MLISGIAHVVRPEIYAGLIPGFMNPSLSNSLAALTETLVGILLFVPKYRHLGGLGFLVLMVAFLPLHALDIFKEEPVFVTKPFPPFDCRFSLF